MLHYYLKQSIGLLGMPSVIGLLIVLLALGYHLRGRPRAACRLYLVAALLTYLASIRLVGDALLGAFQHIRRDILVAKGGRVFGHLCGLVRHVTCSPEGGGSGTLPPERLGSMRVSARSRRASQ